MAATFGLDFGTTNSVIAVVRPDPENPRRERCDVLTQRGRPHPSVVSYASGDPVVGQEARNQLSELILGVSGNIVRSPKIYLGSPSGIAVGGVNRPAVDVVADVLHYLRQDAQKRGYQGNVFESTVITIPVTLRGPARADLRQAAQKTGMRIHQFVHEPLAALYGYLRAQANFRQELANLERRLVLVFDWGGGTLDLTLCQVHNGILTQVANAGNAEVGGDRFDDLLRQLVRQKHEAQYPQADWSRPGPGAEARLLQACEDAKIALSSSPSRTLIVRDLLAVSGPEKDLNLEVTASDFYAVASDLIRKGLHTIEAVLDKANVQRSAIEFCIATGGMVSMPAIRERLRELFGMSRLRLVNNAATIIAEGAAWIAHDDVSLQLAKPIELLHADNSYVQVVPSGTNLPVEGKAVRRHMNMYCVDPSDGFAKFYFVRPRWPGRESQSDERLPYGHLTLPVDSSSRPLFERLQVDITINHDLIATMRAQSLMRKATREVLVHDLEFGLSLLGGVNAE